MPIEFYFTPELKDGRIIRDLEDSASFARELELRPGIDQRDEVLHKLERAESQETAHAAAHFFVRWAEELDLLDQLLQAQLCHLPSGAQCAAVLREALATPGPALIEATVDPNELPLPPKATFEQTKNLVEALARGTPDAGQIARNSALGKIRELI